MTTAALNPADPILLVDDEPAWLQSLTRNLEYFGNFNHLVPCSDSREVLGLLRTRKFSVVLLDLVMPHIEGADLLIQIGMEYPELPVIVLSGMNQLDTAVHCMKLGAFDYHVKTAEANRLWTSIRRALELTSLSHENRELSSRLLSTELRNAAAFAPIVTRSPRMEGIFRYLEAIASSPGPVLFLGPTGTGKRLLARTLATLSAPNEPFICCRAGDLDAAEGEQLLFGSAEQGGLCEATRKGVLLIEDIDQLPHTAQALLASILKRGEFPSRAREHWYPLQFRIFGTASIDPAVLVEDGRFRRDLSVLLASHQITVPSLRERSEDLPLLLQYFLDLACIARGRKTLKCPDHLAALLIEHHFSGNLTELRALVDAAVAASPGSRLSLAPFRRALREAPSLPPDSSPSAPTLLITGHFPTLSEARELLVQDALQRAGGSQTVAARLLGITQPALSHLLKRKATSSLY
jgi:DNA-binding NtrC family response regulator